MARMDAPGGTGFYDEDTDAAEEPAGKVAKYEATKASKKKASEDRAMKATKAASAAAMKTPFPVASRVGGQTVFVDDQVYLTSTDRDARRKASKDKRGADVMAGFAMSPQGRAAAARAKTKRAPVFLAEKATGEDVVFLQEFLQEQGFDIGPTGADGSFGPNTTAAVKAFQKDRGLFPDGLVGDKTMTALREVQMAANAEAAREYAAKQAATAAPAAPAKDLTVVGQTLAPPDEGLGLEQDLIRRFLGMDPKKKQQILDAVASSMKPS